MLRLTALGIAVAGALLGLTPQATHAQTPESDRVCVEALTQDGSTCEPCAECLCDSCQSSLAACYLNPDPGFVGLCTKLVDCITNTGCSGDDCYRAATCKAEIDRAAWATSNPAQTCSLPPEEDACAAATAFVTCAARCSVCETCPGEESSLVAPPPTGGRDGRSAQLVSLLFAAVIFPLAFIGLEKGWPSIRGRRVLRRGFGSDVVWYGVQSVVSRAVAPVVVFFALLPVVWLSGMTPERFFSGFGPAGGLPLTVQVPIVFVLADFFLYWQHRLFHHPALWTFHAVHHSSSDLDWLSATRMHPANEIGAQLVSASPVLLLGFHPLTFVLLAPFFAVYSVFIHANLRWDFGPLRRVVASPVFHRWHHTVREEGLDKNFSSYLPVWDVLFGTWHMPASRRPEAFGSDDPVPEGFVRQLLYPLRPSSWRSARP